MEVSASGYYAWRKRLTKPPSVKCKSLKQIVHQCYFENRRRYGARRIAKSLSRNGTRIGRRKVSGLMKEEDLKAIQPKSYKPKTTDSKGTTAAPNLLTNIELKECAPTKIIIGDITYIRLRGKFCYLAVWQDKVTRRISGWSLELEMTAELVISALQKGIGKGLSRAGAIVHSDRDSQYAANGFRELLRRNGFQQSMSGKGKGSR